MAQVSSSAYRKSRSGIMDLRTFKGLIAELKRRR